MSVHRRATAHVSHHYFRLMPNKKHHRIVVWVVFLFLAAVLSAQMLYPIGRAMPFATLGDTRVSGWTHDRLAGELATRFEKTTVSLRSSTGATVTVPLKKAGAEQQASAAIDQLGEYPYMQRFIPFSLLWQKPSVRQSSVIFSPQVLDEFSATVAKQLSFEPKNATLTIKDGSLVATEDVDGQTVTPEAIRRALETTDGFRLASDTAVDLISEPKVSTTTADDFSAVRTMAEQALSRRVSIAVGDSAVQIEEKQQASWLEISANKSGTPTIALNKKAVKTYLTGLNKLYGASAGVTNINLVNGVETSRTTGKTGKTVDVKSMVDAVNTHLFSREADNSAIPLQFTVLAAPVQYNGRYTASEAGLRAYVRDTTRDGSVAISIRQLNGAGWSADGGGSTSRVSASTFKLYVSLYLFDQMSRGKTAWGDSMLGTTVSTCFDRMTIASTNPCAYDWLSQWGRSNVNAFLYKKGFTGATSFTNPLAAHTSTNDLVKIMAGLEDGSLIGGEQRSRLLHSLSVHPYRSGVPAGSSGSVYDKVGFLWDYINDAAIVRHPQGTYVIAVMTKGHSYAKVASITREVEKILYP